MRLHIYNNLNQQSLNIASIFFLLILSISSNLIIDPALIVYKTLFIGTINIIIFIFVVRYTFGKNIEINLLIVFIIGLFISGILPQLYLVLRLESVPFIDPWNSASEFSNVSTYTLIGIIFLIIGYNSTSKSRQKKSFSHKPIYSTAIYLNLIIIFFVLAWTARFVLFINGAYYFAYKEANFIFGQWYSVLSQISNLGIFALIILFLLTHKTKKYYKLLWLVLSFELLWVIPSGARTSIAIIILVIGFFYWYRDRAIPIKKLVFIFIIFTLSFPVLGLYRYTIGDYSDISSFSFENTVMALNAANKLTQISDQMRGMNNFDSFIRRLYDGNSLGFLLINYHQDYDWQYGWTIFRGIVGIAIPYFIFPARDINQLTLNEWYPQIQLGGSSPVTFMGEGYMNFSYFGFIILPLMLGYILKKTDSFFKNRSSNLIYNSLYLFLLVNFVFMYSQGMVIMLSTFRLVFIYGVFTFILLQLINPRKIFFAYKKH